MNDKQAENAPAFHFAADHLQLGDIALGWTARDWAIELRRKSERCKADRPDLARHYDAWALDIESRLPAEQG